MQKGSQSWNDIRREMKADPPASQEPAVHRVAEVDIDFEASPWDFAVKNAEEIARHWSVRSRENPGFFEGTVLMLRTHSLSGSRFSAVAMPVQFSQYLFWREHGQPDRSVRHVFSGAAIELAGGILAVQAGPDTLNAGRLHLPGGFVDMDDVIGKPPVQKVDVRRQFIREAGEELGLLPADLSEPSCYYITTIRSEIGIVASIRTDLSEAEVHARLQHHHLATGDREVKDVLVVREPREIAEQQAVPHVATVLKKILSRRRAPHR